MRVHPANFDQFRIQLEIEMDTNQILGLGDETDREKREKLYQAQFDLGPNQVKNVIVFDPKDYLSDHSPQIFASFLRNLTQTLSDTGDKELELLESYCSQFLTNHEIIQKLHNEELSILEESLIENQFKQLEEEIIKRHQEICEAKKKLDDVDSKAEKKSIEIETMREWVKDCQSMVGEGNKQRQQISKLESIVSDKRNEFANQSLEFSKELSQKQKGVANISETVNNKIKEWEKVKEEEKTIEGKFIQYRTHMMTLDQEINSLHTSIKHEKEKKLIQDSKPKKARLRLGMGVEAQAQVQEQVQMQMHKQMQVQGVMEKEKSRSKIHYEKAERKETIVWGLIIWCAIIIVWTIRLCDQLF